MKLINITNWLAKHAKQIIILILLVIYLLVYNPIFVKFFLRTGKPTSVGEVQGEYQEFYYSIDKFEPIYVEGQETFQLSGWAFPIEFDLPLKDYRKQIVLIDKKSKGYFFDTQLFYRVELTEYFQELNLDLDTAGFFVNISKQVLPPGEYKIAFLYTSPDGNQSKLFETFLVIRRTPNHLELIR